ncbi:glycerophosphodiester phosphodiesterase [Phocicoccus pinnipedialis]|uniref:Putative glycerophosphoryl diester phosphodiesterase 1 n=1 Tax=Phocicoccus pinnipedialis TaxID=110845 RepID=A0A6V7RHQ6_9BACL|nr:glycerophosphodiester phosphodiesterase [Jeotgalicoccus pinnipedialis]MBP1939024.1 glycerophosphoryl diester phosphodiesterase [Jeotgalicoccus pinnipedialis]CAD2077130.1 putative glycerophosphoryl diester phosphodiesterase 1 [Jeotgalicoccus pinnipedialis]
MTNIKNILLSSVLIGGAIYTATKLIRLQPVMEIKPYFKRKSPYLFAHRGGLGLRPEHTKLAFDNALNFAVDGFEIDIRLTKDEEIVVFHDEYIDRVSDGFGKVSDYTLEELSAFDFAYHFKLSDDSYPYRGHEDAKVMTLEELLDKYPDMLINIDIKDPIETRAGCIVVKKLYDLLERKNVRDRVLVTSFQDAQIKQFDLYAKGKYAIGAGVDEVLKAYTSFVTSLGHMYTPTRDTFQLPIAAGTIRLDTKSFINFMKKLNIAPGYWVINDVEQMSQLLDRGAQTIVTDYPDIAYHVLRDQFHI